MLDLSGVTGWDSLLVVCCRVAQRWCENRGAQFDLQRLPEDLRRLIELSEAVAPLSDQRSSMGGAFSRFFSGAWLA